MRLVRELNTMFRRYFMRLMKVWTGTTALRAL